MKRITRILIILALLTIYSCNTTPKNKTNSSNRLEFTVSKIQNEKDGQTVFLKDDKNVVYTTIISPANDNFVDLEVGNRISLIAKKIMENDPAQIISTDIKVLNQISESKDTAYISPIKTKISTNKNIYKIGESIELSMEVKNTGEKPYTFLPWGTPVENRFTRRCLKITHNNKTIDYSGITVKRVPPTEKDYITLKTAKTAIGKVNLLKGYKLTEKGVYSIQFEETYKGLPISNIIKVEIK